LGILVFNAFLACCTCRCQSQLLCLLKHPPLLNLLAAKSLWAAQRVIVFAAFLVPQCRHTQKPTPLACVVQSFFLCKHAENAFLQRSLPQTAKALLLLVPPPKLISLFGSPLTFHDFTTLRGGSSFYYLRGRLAGYLPLLRSGSHSVGTCRGLLNFSF
jgi:hypothetical protein